MCVGLSAKVVKISDGTAVVDGVRQTVKPGDVIRMNAGVKHTVIAGERGLQLIEVQLGDGITVLDKKKFDLE